MTAALDYLAFFATSLAGYLALYLTTNAACWCIHSGRLWGDPRESRIQADRVAPAGQVAREIRLSVLNLPFFALSATIVYALYRQGWTRIYLDLAEASRLYFAVSVLLVMAVHETYFYWMHRLLHWKPLFRRVHRLHHLSVTPTSWAGYATHPIEGLLMSGNLILPPLLFPVHPLAMVLYVVVQMSYSTFGHSGHDGFPDEFRRRWYLSWHNTPSHHDDHHRYVHGNFGHYVNLWDWLMRTELPHGDLLRRRKRPPPRPRSERREGTWYRCPLDYVRDDADPVQHR
jgi:sterol desaturase/sphingolipid hydroxylase (fatty acid hydroxylase superfamily)